MDSLTTNRMYLRRDGEAARMVTASGSSRRGRTRRGRGDGEKGQAFVLAALTLFILAAMTMMSFNLGNAIHERIRIQHHSDAVAYSMAVTTARTFNYFAYSNRAIAAGYAAMATMHAYMSSVTVTWSLLKAAETNFWIIFAMEIAKVATRWCGPIPCAFEHIPHAVTAAREAVSFRNKANDQADKIADADKAFQDTIQWLNRMINLIHASQASMMVHAVGVASRAGTLGDDPIERLEELNAPNAEWAVAVSLMNTRNVSCAVDGAEIAGLCDGPDDVDDEHRRKVMTHVANGTRADWTAKRPFFPLHLALFIFDEDEGLYPEHHDIPGLPLGHKGTARLIDSNDKDELHSTNEDFEGQVVGADEHGGILLNLGDCFTPFPSIGVSTYRAEVFTNPDGGKHYAQGGFSRSTDGDFHDGGDHDQFDGIETASNRVTCAFGLFGGGLCFMKFRADPDPDNHFGQPAIYSAYAQDLGLLNEGGTLDGEKRGAWEVNSDGELRIQGPNIRKGTVTGGMDVEDGVQTAALTLRPGDGVAISKALVYYHRMGNWREQPNFFNPYWRAKLHPFNGLLEASLVAGAAGRPDAAEVYTAQKIAPGRL